MRRSRFALLAFTTGVALASLTSASQASTLAVETQSGNDDRWGCIHDDGEVGVKVCVRNPWSARPSR